MNEERWLDKKVYSKIKRDGKKIGAIEIDVKYLYHKAWFKYVVIYFAFHPFEYKIHFKSNCTFNICDIDDVKNDLDKANEFVKYITAINNDL